MGNCLRKTSSMEWGGEDWGSFGSDDKTRIPGGWPPEYMQKSGESKSGLSRSMAAAAAAATEVKIKISRKELEKLLKEADIEGLSAQQVLAQLMNVSDQFETHQRSWIPALCSIPE